RVFAPLPVVGSRGVRRLGERERRARCARTHGSGHWRRHGVLFAALDGRPAGRALRREGRVTHSKRKEAMTQQSIDGAPKAELTAARTGDAGAGGREPWRRQHVVRTQVKRAFERAAEAGAKAVVAVVEINPEYAGRAPQRLAAVLAQWRH